VSTLRSQALKFLARREHSRTELGIKLSRLGSPEEIALLLDNLELSGLLSDARTAAAYLRGHAGRYGTAKLRHTLRAKGIESEQIDASLAEAHASETLESEQVRAGALWRRKFGTPPKDAHEWARQARFLQSRGFPGDVIKKTLKAKNDDDS
jgi:regulatory protein